MVLDLLAKFKVKNIVSLLFVVAILIPGFVRAIGSLSEEELAVETVGEPAPEVASDVEMPSEIPVEVASPEETPVEPVLADAQPVVDVAAPLEDEEDSLAKQTARADAELLSATPEETPAEPVLDAPTEVVEEVAPAILSVAPPVLDVVVDPQAAYACEAEQFMVDITKQDSATNIVQLTGAVLAHARVLITSMPVGIDVHFLDSNTQSLDVANASQATVVINKAADAQVGSFNIMFAYTDLDSNLATVCQMNLVNQ